jgi:hypothetical protein
MRAREFGDVAGGVLVDEPRASAGERLSKAAGGLMTTVE